MPGRAWRDQQQDGPLTIYAFTKDGGASSVYAVERAFTHNPVIGSHKVAFAWQRLVFVKICHIMAGAMNNWSVRQIFAIVLAVFVTMGMSLSVVQANDMAVKMATSSDMAVAGHGDCHGCDGGDAGKTKAMVCTIACVTPVAGVLQIGPVVEISAPAKLGLPRTALLLGTTLPPDPYPPRSTDIG